MHQRYRKLRCPSDLSLTLKKIIITPTVVSQTNGRQQNFAAMICEVFIPRRSLGGAANGNWSRCDVVTSR